jgi:hypothetical protein
MPTFCRMATLVEAVQWNGDDEAWSAVCALHADSELVAFNENDGTVSIETTGGRVTAQLGDWIVKAEPTTSRSAGLMPSPRSTSRRKWRAYIFETESRTRTRCEYSHELKPGPGRLPHRTYPNATDRLEATAHTPPTSRSESRDWRHLSRLSRNSPVTGCWL